MEAVQVNDMNSYRFADNYRIESQDGFHFYGVEHNQTEAEAIARYLTNYHARKIVAVRNQIEAVRVAKKIRVAGEVSRVKNREMILKTMGAV